MFMALRLISSVISSGFFPYPYYKAKDPFKRSFVIVQHIALDPRCVETFFSAYDVGFVLHKIHHHDNIVMK